MQKRKNNGFTTFELLFIFVIVCVLSAVVMSKYGEVRQNTRNEHRKADIVALQTAIDTYKSSNSKYPSLSQINSSSFRKSNLLTINDSNLQDPLWTKNTSCKNSNLASMENSVKPVTGCYGYALSPENCDNVTIDCTSYTLTVNLEPAGTYTKISTD